LLDFLHQGKSPVGRGRTRDRLERNSSSDLPHEGDLEGSGRRQIALLRGARRAAVGNIPRGEGREEWDGSPDLGHQPKMSMGMEGERIPGPPLDLGLVHQRSKGLGLSKILESGVGE
jgi:hypothetical protein